MSIEKVVNITVNTKGANTAIAQTEKLNTSLKKLDKTTGDVKGGMKESGNAILENGGAMGLLNDATGGFAMTIKDAVEATALFSKGTTIATTAQKVYTLVVGSTTGALKALRIALVSTGLGAIVVLLGLFIAKMNESAEATENEKSATDALNKSLQTMNELYKDSISSLETVNKERVLRAKIAGKSEKDIQAIEKETANERYRLFKEEDARIQREKLNKKLTVEQRAELNKQELANQKEYFKSLNDEKVKDLENDLSIVEAQRQAEKDRLQKLKDDAIQKEKERLQGILDARKEYADKTKEFQKELDEIDDAKRKKEYEDAEAKKGQVERNLQSQADGMRSLNEYNKKLAEDQKILDKSVGDAKVDIAMRTMDLISEIAGKGSKVGKALAVAQATMNGIQGVQSAFTSASASPITTVFPAYPFVQAGLAGAFSLLQIKKIMSTDPTGKSGGGGGSASSGGGSTPSAPSFNLVAGTGSNQIAEGLAGQRQPIQAYVVSGAVTNAQQMQRNIVNDASL